MELHSEYWIIFVFECSHTISEFFVFVSNADIILVFQIFEFVKIIYLKPKGMIEKCQWLLFQWFYIFPWEWTFHFRFLSKENSIIQIPSSYIWYPDIVIRFSYQNCLKPQTYRIDNKNSSFLIYFLSLLYNLLNSLQIFRSYLFIYSKVSFAFIFKLLHFKQSFPSR